MSWKVRVEREPGVAPGGEPFAIEGQVGRIEYPSAAAFRKRYLEANRPVLIAGALEDWPAAARWSPEYLCSVVGDRRGEVIVSANGLYPDYLTQPSPMTKVEMELSELMRRALPGEGPVPEPVLGPGETYYIYGKSYLFDRVPRLVEDIRTPEVLEGIEVADRSTWISSAGCVTPLHYDLNNSLLAQVRGSKQVWFFDPGQHDLVYPRGEHFPGLDNYERQSRVDIHHPDYETYPDFRRVRALTVTLRQGDALFIPSNWWHEVESLELSISVGFTFAGGTVESELAVLANIFQKAMGKKGEAMVGGMDLFGRASAGGAAGPQPAAMDPGVLQELMSSPAVQRLLQDPKMMAALARMMSGGEVRT